MKAILARGVGERIGAAARAALPHEACGLLLGERAADRLVVRQATIARNVAALPRHRFEIDPAHLIEVRRAARGGGPAIVGLWHSHPEGPPAPSAADRAGVTDPTWLWLIWAAGTLCAFLPDDGRPTGFRALALLDEGDEPG